MEINGMPAHPLLLHIPVVLVPLTLFGVIIMAMRPSWYLRYRWALLVVALGAGIGGFLAGEAGESLLEMLEEVRGEAWEDTIETHEHAGQFGGRMSFVFMLTVIAYVLIPRFMNRHDNDDPERGGSLTAGPSWLRPVLGGVSIIVGAIAFFGLVRAGDTGAKAVWEPEMEQINSAEGKSSSDDGGSYDDDDEADDDEDDDDEDDD